jgi:hypothetical protein
LWQSLYAARLREIFFPSSVYVSLFLFLSLTPLGLGRKDLVGLLLCGILEELEEHHLLRMQQRKQQMTEKVREERRKHEKGREGIIFNNCEQVSMHMTIRSTLRQQLLAASTLESTYWSSVRIIG